VIARKRSYRLLWAFGQRKDAAMKGGMAGRRPALRVTQHVLCCMGCWLFDSTFVLSQYHRSRS
jgi:hypothetical protein